MKFCPHCGGDLAQFSMAGRESTPPAAGPYNQTQTWKAIQERAAALGGSPPAAESLVLPAAAGIRAAFPIGSSGSWAPLKTIVHLAFDRDVVPRGGVLHHITMRMGRTELDTAHLEGMGYAISDGKVVVVGDVPVGPSYQLLSYWGGDRQHKRWHLEAPCEINPSRNGDPFFMDANMIAFGAVWKDGERAEEALLELLEMFTNGFGAHRQMIAHPLVLQIIRPIQA